MADEEVIREPTERSDNEENKEITFDEASVDKQYSKGTQGINNTERKFPEK